MLLVVGWMGHVHAAEPLPVSATSGAVGVVASPDNAPEGDQRPSFAEALRSLPKDVLHFASVDTIFILGTGGGAAFGAHAWDDEVQAELSDDAAPNGAFAIGNAYGHAAVQAGGALGLFVAGRWSRHDRLAQTGLDLLRAQAVTGVWVQAVKVAVNRERPDGSRYSFPSGHAALAFASAGVVEREYGWKPAVPFFGLAAYAAAARVATNHHYLSDVVFGAAMGLAASHSLRVHERGGRAWLITPVATPGGGGVSCRLVETHRTPS
jgi:membrane-associated phospholipid phosphatase